MVSKGTAVVTLPADTQILITREFDAPKHLVYKAWTTPELVARWWPAGQGSMTVTDVDLRAGGTWRLVMATDDGGQIAYRGEYKEIVPNERIVYTEVDEMAGDDSPGTLCTATFEDNDGRILLTEIVECRTREDRDAIIESGAESGWQESFDHLEKVAISLNR